jgi:hypothetical protein
VAESSEELPPPQAVNHKELQTKVIRDTIFIKFSIQFCQKADIGAEFLRLVAAFTQLYRAIPFLTQDKES